MHSIFKLEYTFYALTKGDVKLNNNIFYKSYVIGGLGMPKSKGYRRKTRSVLSKKKGMVPLTRLLYVYEQGQYVVIDIDSSQPKGMPHRRYQGKVGIVKEVRKRSLVIDVKVGGKTKRVIARFEHVKPFKG